MPRQSRRLSDTGVYHVMLRGVNHCQLFEEPDDYEQFLTRLAAAKNDLAAKVFAYCVMTNHVHLLVREHTPGDIVSLMRKTLTPYAGWFNKKYGRTGALIANRYKSECVQDDAYLLAVVRYIHRNPVEAGLTQRIDSYPWSSYPAYVAGSGSLVDTGFVLAMFGSEPPVAVSRFVGFHQDDPTGLVVSPFPAARDERQIRGEMAARYEGLEPHAIVGLPRARRNAVIAYLRGQGFSVRQIERATGVPRGVISRVEAVPPHDA